VKATVNGDVPLNGVPANSATGRGTGVGVDVEGVIVVDVVGTGADPMAAKFADAIVYDPGVYTTRTVRGVSGLISYRIVSPTDQVHGAGLPLFVNGSSFPSTRIERSRLVSESPPSW
jgi:hypothetical protein